MGKAGSKGRTDAVALALIVGASVATQADAKEAVKSVYSELKLLVGHYSPALSALEVDPSNGLFQRALSEQLHVQEVSDDAAVLEQALRFVRTVQKYLDEELPAQTKDQLRGATVALDEMVKKTQKNS